MLTGWLRRWLRRLTIHSWNGTDAGNCSASTGAVLGCSWIYASSLYWARRFNWRCCLREGNNGGAKALPDEVVDRGLENRSSSKSVCTDLILKQCPLINVTQTHSLIILKTKHCLKLLALQRKVVSPGKTSRLILNIWNRCKTANVMRSTVSYLAISYSG